MGCIYIVYIVKNTPISVFRVLTLTENNNNNKRQKDKVKTQNPIHRGKKCLKNHQCQCYTDPEGKYGATIVHNILISSKWVMGKTENQKLKRGIGN